MSDKNRAPMGLLMAGIAFSRHLPPEPAPAAQEKPRVMPAVPCALCRGRAFPAEAREFRIKIHRRGEGATKLIFLVCPSCSRSLPAGHAEATAEVLRCVGATRPITKRDDLY